MGSPWAENDVAQDWEDVAGVEHLAPLGGLVRGRVPAGGRRRVREDRPAQGAGGRRVEAAVRATSSTPAGPRLVVAVFNGRDDLGIEWEASPDGTNWSAGLNVNRWREGTLGFLVEQLSGGQRQRVDPHRCRSPLLRTQFVRPFRAWLTFDHG